jgi:hypothetical protein
MDQIIIMLRTLAYVRSARFETGEMLIGAEHA